MINTTVDTAKMINSVKNKYNNIDVTSQMLKFKKLLLKIRLSIL